MSAFLTEEQIDWRPPAETPTIAGRTVPTPRFFRPLSNAADDYIKWAQTPERRIDLGVTEIDAEMRGTAPGEMTELIGHTHNGKTLVLLHGLKHNRTKRVAMFIPDEPATLVLAKLCSVYFGIDAKRLEAGVADRNATIIDLLRQTATEAFPNLVVFDSMMTPEAMEYGLEEAKDYWGAGPDLIIVDYLELVDGFDSVPAAANFLKGLGKQQEAPMWVVHQTSRSSGAGGKKLTIDSGAYGGAAQATAIIGVRRRKFELMAERDELLAKRNRSASDDDRLSLVEYQLEVHRYTVTASLLKNKRPGGTTLEDGVDLELNTSTGALLPIRNGEMPRQYLDPHTFAQQPDLEVF